MSLLENPYGVRLYNDVLIRSNTEVDDLIQYGSLTLFKDTTYDDQRSKRIYGEVISVPYKLKRTPVHQVDDEFPKGSLSFSHDEISRLVHLKEKQVGRRLTVSELSSYRGRYCSSPYIPDMTYVNDQPMLACVGDTGWFHYLGLSKSSYVGQDKDHNRYYKIPYESFFCFTNDKEVKMVNGYVQVEPYWGEYEDIKVDGKIIKGKLKGNLVVGLANAPEFRTGVIHRKGPDFGRDTRKTLQEGDIVIYRKGSEFKNCIQGKEVYLMPQWQIIARKEGSRLMPVGNYVQLKVKKKHQGIVLCLNDVIEDKAEVTEIGERCEYVIWGDVVHINPKAIMYNVEDTVFLKEGHILGYYLPGPQREKLEKLEKWIYGDNNLIRMKTRIHY